MRTRAIITTFLSLLSCLVFGNVQISSLQDFNFGAINLPSSQLQQTDYICLYTTASNRMVNITGSSPNVSSGNFQLVKGSSKITYTVGIASAGSSSFNSLTPNVSLNTRGQNSQATCNGLPTSSFAQLRIIIPASSLTASLVSGNYSDTLTLILSP